MANQIYMFRTVTECVTVRFDDESFEGDEDGAIRDIMAKRGTEYVAAAHGEDLKQEDSGWGWTGAIHPCGEEDVEQAKKPVSIVAETGAVPNYLEYDYVD